MSGLVRHEQRRPVRRAELRAFLLAAGPQDLEHLLAYAHSIDPATDEDWLLEQLTTRTRLFEQLPDGRFKGRPEEEEVVVTRRQPRPRPRPHPSSAASDARWTPPPRPEPRGRGVEVDEERGFRRVEVADPSAWQEAGRRITVSLPIDGPASDPVLESIAAAANSTTEVEVFTAAQDGVVVYRGTRHVVRTEIDRTAGRTRVTFGSAADDIGLAYNRAVGLLGSAGTGPTALTPYRPEAERVELTPTAAEAARLPVPTMRSTGAYRAELGTRLAALTDRSLTWDAFVEWLVPLTRRVGQQDFEHIVRQLCGTDAVPKGGLLALLVDDLHVDEVEDPACARALLITAAETPDRRAELALWALENHAGVALRGASVATTLHIGRLAAAAAVHERASDNFAACAEELEDRLTDPDLEDWIHSAIVAGAAAQLQAATDIVLKRAMLDPSRAASERDLLHMAVDTAQDHQLSVHDLLVRAVEANLALPELEAEAIELARTYIGDVSDSEQLELLSQFETARLLVTIDWLQNAHLTRVSALWDQLAPRAKTEERARLELIGSIVGRSGLSEEFPLSDNEQLAPKPVEDSSPLEKLRGRNVLLVGGHTSTFERVRTLLQPSQPGSFEHIEPSWDRNRTARSLKPLLVHADVVIEATSQMQHQDSEVLKAALGSPPSAKRIRAAGGPSMILHHVENALRRS